MNKQQKEILKSQLSDEEKVLKNLRGIYKKALDDIDDNIAALLGRTDTENLQSIIYQVDYQKALKAQINGILDKMNSEQFTTVSDYLSKCYESGFLGTMYDLQGQGIPLIMPIDQKQVVQALVHDTKLSKSLYQTFGENVASLKKRIQNDISRGIAQGSSYADIARNVASGMVGDYSKMRGGALSRAYTIARTEGHRIQNQAAFDAQKRAKEKGANIVKQWDSTLDGRTRPSHRMVDGEIKELDEPFSNDLMMPGDKDGKAAEVVNCRCALLQRARWALDEAELKTLQDRAAYFGLDKTENFEDFKTKYTKTVDNYGNDSYNGNIESGIILARKDSNIGAFSHLKVPMQKKSVSKICEKYGIDTTGLTTKIQRSEDFLSLNLAGSTDYDNIGRIDLFPNAFIDEDELIKTIIHEKTSCATIKRTWERLLSFSFARYGKRCL